jgi:hypothetical protein
VKGLRDRALRLLGFAGAFHPYELVGLDVADLDFCDGGLRVNRPGGQRLNHWHPGKLDRSPRRRDCSNSSQTASARCGLRT